MLTIGSFTYNGVTYERFLDVTTPDSPVVVLHTLGLPVLAHVSEANRGEVDGQLFAQPYGQQCYTDESDPFLTEYFYKLYSQPDTPFASVITEVEGCPSFVCDLLIGEITTTDETGINLGDGSMSAVITTSHAPFKCSIDNINFGPPNTCNFSPLKPGNYTLYVYDGDSCTATHAFTINKYAAVSGCTDPAASNYNPSAQINDGTCVYPLPDDNAENVNNLYEKPDQFRLTYQDASYQIDEPKDWDKISVVLKRDDIYHGVNYEFSEGDIKLRFDDAAGQQLLQTAYANDGNDALVRFQFGYDQFGNFIPYFDGFVDFNSYELQEFYTSCGVKRKIFTDLLETRADVLVRLQDGAIELPLHSKLIRESTIVNEGALVGDTESLSINDYNGALPPTNGDAPYLGYYSLLDFSGATQNDLAGSAQPAGIYTDDPIKVSNYLFKTDGGGTFTFNMDFAISINIKLGQTGICVCPGGHNCGPRHGYWSYRWVLVVNNFPNYHELPTTIDSLGGGVSQNSGFTNSRYNDFICRLSGYSKTLTLNQGDEVYLYGIYICEKRGCLKDAEVHLDRISEVINITGDTLGLQTSTKAFLAFEAAQAVLTYVTDGQLANSGQVLTAKANLKSNLLGRTDLGYGADGCAALIAYSNGYQIRGFDIANRPIYISFTDFMQGLNAMYCIGMGYEVDSLGNYLVRLERFDYFYQDVEIMIFGEVSDYLEDIDLTLVYNEMEFGYNKFTNNLPSSNNTLDEFCTDHDYLTPIQSYKQKLTQKCAQIASGYAIELTRRQYFTATPNDSWTYDDDNFVISSVRKDGGFASETNENFTVSGVIGPDSVYNVRLSPKRMLDRWSKWVNSGLAYKKTSDQVINTYVAYNGDLVSQLITPDDCDSTQQFTESQSITLGELGGFVKQFLPTKITFNKRISWETLTFLIRCFQNQDTTGRNNGYISVIDCNGVTQQGYLTELQYNPESELANFTLRKKYVDLSVPFDCSVYSSDDFADFEATTGLPAEIEQCKFENFA